LWPEPHVHSPRLRHHSTRHWAIQRVAYNIRRAYSQNFFKTPSLNSFAGEALTFTRAYAQQAVCGPSRKSFLSGQRPDTTKTYSFAPSFRDVGRDWERLPQFFLNQGYFSCSEGKSFHDDATYSSPAYGIAHSWSQICDYPAVPKAKRDSCLPNT
jgi:arylsulfatase A-like enzyme